MIHFLMLSKISHTISRLTFDPSVYFFEAFLEEGKTSNNSRKVEASDTGGKSEKKADAKDK